MLFIALGVANGFEVSAGPDGRDPAFANNLELWLAPVAPDPADDGSPERPFGVGDPGGFDRFMSRFKGVPFLTFRLSEGVFETGGVYEVPPGERVKGDVWEPENGWRILGQGIGRTFIRLSDPKEKSPTRYQVIGNPVTGRLVKHVEIGDMTVDAQGALHSATIDSNFGCVHIMGSFVNLHDLECIGGFNAMLPGSPNSFTHRELFILGLGGIEGSQVTNNIIERCIVRISPGSPKPFPGAIQGLTTAIINAANVGAPGKPDSLTYHPRVVGCLVDGFDVRTRVNGISVFGSSNGVVQGNTIINSRFGFYSDDSRHTPSVYVANNVISNSITGIYLNYFESGYPWGTFAVLNNTISLCDECSYETNRPAQGILLFEAAPPRPPSLQTAVVAGNSVASIRGYTAGRDVDIGIQLTWTRRALVEDNRVSVLRRANSLKVLRDPSRDEQYWFLHNRTHASGGLMVHDRSLPGCGSTMLPNITSCQFTNSTASDPWAEGLFAFSLAIPALLPYPPSPLPQKDTTLFWGARDLAVVSPSSLLETGDGLLDAAVIPAGRDRGGIRATFHVDREGDYSMWMRLRSDDPRSIGFADVEVDGQRELFAADHPGTSTNWEWRLVTRRLEGSNASVPRTFKFSSGWHELVAWSRNPDVALGGIILTTTEAARFAPNDAIVKRYLPVWHAADSLALKRRWEVVLPVTGGVVEFPMQLITGRPEVDGGTLAVSEVSDRGAVRLRVRVPRSQRYQLAVRMSSSPEDPAMNDTLRIRLDGVDWFAVAEPGEGLHWTRRIARTEQQARQGPQAPPPTRLAAGWHDILIASRHSGVAVHSVMLSAAE